MYIDAKLTMYIDDFNYYLIIIICYMDSYMVDLIGLVVRVFANGPGDLGSIPGRVIPCGVMVKAMDCGIVVREFVLQSRYYVHFRANNLGKGMNPLILPAMG